MRDPTWAKIDLTGKTVCAVVGPQNCGKSTLVKYLVNRLRSSADSQTKLCVLDVDCGQPTFNLPGTIALHQVKTNTSGELSIKPELVTLKEVFLNSASPALDPETYLDVVTDLIDLFQSLSGSCT